MKREAEEQAEKAAKAAAEAQTVRRGRSELARVESRGD